MKYSSFFQIPWEQWRKSEMYAKKLIKMQIFYQAKNCFPNKLFIIIVF